MLLALGLVNLKMKYLALNLFENYRKCMKT